MSIRFVADFRLSCDLNVTEQILRSHSIISQGWKNLVLKRDRIFDRPAFLGGYALCNLSFHYWRHPALFCVAEMERWVRNVSRRPHTACTVRAWYEITAWKRSDETAATMATVDNVPPGRKGRYATGFLTSWLSLARVNEDDENESFAERGCCQDIFV